MLNFSSLLKYCKQHELLAEEALFLYTVHVRNSAPNDKDFMSLSTHYYQHNMFYDKGSMSIGMTWETMVDSLVTRGFLDAYPHYKKKREGQLYIDLTRLEVTDKFKDTLFDGDREKWWNHFMATYGYTSYRNGKEYNTLWIDKQYSMEDVKAKFWALCQNGNMHDIGYVLTKTEEYVEVFGNNLTVFQFLRDFEGIMERLEKYQEAEQRRRSKSYL